MYTLKIWSTVTVWKSKTQVMSYEFKPRVTSSNSRFASSNPRVTSSKTRVRRLARLKARVARLKAHELGD